MKHQSQRSYLLIRAGGLLLLLLLVLSACSTSSSSRSYPSRTYVYQPQVNSPYHRPNYMYYGTYQPGWFIGSRYPGGYYGGGYGTMAYWPTYSYSNYAYAHYSNYYYPYYDYSNSFYYRPVYGYGYGYNPYSRHSNYGYTPYYGGSHSYQPPGNQQYPPQSRPDPVVIPREQRGRRGPSEDYSDEIAERQRQSELRQPERRSTTVVTEPQGMSRSVSASPAQNGDQGMVITSRSERKVQRSRLEPVVTQPGDGSVSEQNSRQKFSNQTPAQPENSAMPVTRIDRTRAYGTTRTDSANIRPVDSSNGSPRHDGYSSPRRMEQAPSRTAPAYQQPTPRNEPAYQPSSSRSESPARSEPSYQQQIDSSNVIPEADRRQHRDVERDSERDQQHD
ncbi:MAG: hypothetical protein SH820_03135 [Xanthomonadales bacterium]|nr:hypothetical protein [Xanthomonadales bacterium]